MPAELKAELNGWIIAPGDLRSGVWPRQKELRVYYTLEPTEHVITELDVVYGDDEPFFGFQRAKGGPVVKADKNWDTVDVAFRRGAYAPPRASPPRFHEDGGLKIMQSEWGVSAR